MPSITTIGNRAYPSIPEITEDTATHTVALQAIKSALATHERRDRDTEDSFIRFGELVDLGIINAEGDLILETGGIGSLTVEDEGTPLVTLADTLNFVGAGVTATGAAGVKTITIPGGGGGGVDSFEGRVGAVTAIVGDYAGLYVDSFVGRVGAVVAVDADYASFYLQKALVAQQTVIGDVIFSGEIDFTNVFGVQFGPSCELDLRNPSDDTTWFMQYTAQGPNMGLAGSDFNSVFMDFGSSFTHFRMGDPLLMTERAAAVSSVTARGQIWVRDDSPNILMFTDDAGTDWIVDLTLA